MPSKPASGKAPALPGGAESPSRPNPTVNDEGIRSEQTCEFAHFVTRVVIPALTKRWLRQHRSPDGKQDREKEVASSHPPALP